MIEFMDPRRATSAGKRLKLILLSAGERAELAMHAERLLPLIQSQADVHVRDLSLGEDLSQLEFDLAVVVGGDGSILRAVHQMGRRQRPILGVNLGKLGFLADLSPDEFIAELPTICSGQLPSCEHLMYECSVTRGERVVHAGLGLNEVAVLAGPPFAILDIDLYVDSELVTTYSCDGLILSTPVGSTAHSLSAGGPILRQDLQAFVILPISPHTLTNRPVVDSADRIYELVIPNPHEGTSIVADGRVVCQVEPGDRVRIERSDARFQLVALPGHSYYRTLREKLGWGGRLKMKT
ncbi:MAG: NAD(+)/NADH kinase [Planctomycetia bacterium]|nr:NAD(+)/NADH kinase [Planctomycetia bacterium]